MKKASWMTLWEPVELEENTVYRWRVGPLTLWIRRSGNEWLQAHLHEPGGDGSYRLLVARPSVKPPLPDWNRLICPELSHRFRLGPLLPDRPVVVGSSKVLKLLPGCHARFFVMIPLCLRLEVGGANSTPLVELPSVVLSNTWFGGLTYGELCYSLKTTAHMALGDLEPPPHMLLCPVHLRNTSNDALDFQKLCIHVEHLKVYASLTRLWSNEVTIAYEGENALSHVKYGDAAPAFDEGCRLVSAERVPAGKSIFKKSFGFLRYFTTTE